MNKRIPPDPNAPADVLIEQLRSYAENAAAHCWSRQWMGIAADRIEALNEALADAHEALVDARKDT